MGKYLEILNIINLRKTLKQQLQLQDFQQGNKCVIDTICASNRQKSPVL